MYAEKCKLRIYTALLWDSKQKLENEMGSLASPISADGQCLAYHRENSLWMCSKDCLEILQAAYSLAIFSQDVRFCSKF
jgi:hypothetical protein